MNKFVPTLAACALLSACVSAPPPSPTVDYQPPPRPHVAPKTHHARKKPVGGTVEAANGTACPWPAHSRPTTARLETTSTQVPMPAGSSQDTVEGCAVLRFGVSKAGAVSYVDVVSAKPDTVAPVALKCLLAARFRPSSHPDEEALIRVELRSPQPDLVVASLKMR